MFNYERNNSRCCDYIGNAASRNLTPSQGSSFHQRRLKRDHAILQIIRNNVLKRAAIAMKTHASGKINLRLKATERSKTPMGAATKLAKPVHTMTRHNGKSALTRKAPKKPPIMIQETAKGIAVLIVERSGPCTSSKSWLARPTAAKAIRANTSPIASAKISQVGTHIALSASSVLTPGSVVDSASCRFL